MSLAPAWRQGEDGGFAQPATIEFDEAVQSGYGLDRLEIRECELRYPKDVEDVLSDVDAVIYCASAFNSFRQRLPDRLDDAAGKIAKGGMALFELRFGDALFGEQRGGGDDAERSDANKARQREASGKTADVEGMQNALSVLQKSRKRRATLAALTGGQAGGGGASSLGVPFVLVSSAAALGYDSSPYSSEVRENEFGYRKRTAEAALRASDLEHVIVRAAQIDDVRVEENLRVETDEAVVAEKLAAEGGEAGEAGAVGVRDDAAKKRRIHPRDLAKFAVDCLADEPPATGSRTVEVHTFVMGKSK